MGQKSRGITALDRDVYQLVCKICDEHDLQNDSRPLRTRLPFISEKIRKSNSSLSRKPKKALEQSIEIALDQICRDGSASGQDSSLDELDVLELSRDSQVDVMERSRDSQVLNKRVVRRWSQAPKQRPYEEVHERHIERTTVHKRSSDGEPVSKRKRTVRVLDQKLSGAPSLTDLGGVDSIIDQLTSFIATPLLGPFLYELTEPPRGVLLHGPPGSGKTKLAKAFAAELGVALLTIYGPSIVSGMSGESEKALRERFEEAQTLAPCLIFIDEIDAISPKRESAQREMERRIVAQLLECLDDLAPEKTGGKPVMVIAATNRPDSLDPALRRGGRLDKEIAMGMPSESEREEILKVLTNKMTLADDFDLKALARLTPGFVGADLNDLITTANEAAISRFFGILNKDDQSMNMDVPFRGKKALAHRVTLLGGLDRDTCKISITYADFITSLAKIQPMAKREGFASIPDTTWADIGALKTVRAEIWNTIIEPIKNPEKYARVGITAPTAALLWGPPGCGKTLLAKAVAHEAKASFMSVKGPELLNKYVGESERAVRQVFERARATVPCIIFIDELESLAPNRDSTLSESSARVVNTLLIEMDGLGKREGIYILGATNRPDMIDDALLRSGRIETMLFVGLPKEDERVEILRTLTRNLNVKQVEIDQVARGCDGFSGADLAKLVRTAGHSVVNRNGEHFSTADFVRARKCTVPTVENIKKYERLEERWGSMRGGHTPNTGNLVANDVPN